MSDEAELLNEFTARGSEAAFDGLIRLHAKLVFATALRQLGDCGLAEEVAQNVFTALAERAPALRSNTTLAGWLYRTTINQARQRLRSELRRQNRERIAAAIAETARDGDSIWVMLLPLLDEALLNLQEKDRLAVILHFMEERTFREVGLALGVGEDAARKRVQRVVSDLTSWFSQRGVVAPATAMVAALSLQGVEGVTFSAAVVLGAASSAATTSAPLVILGIIMKSTQVKVALGVLALILAATTPVVWHHSRQSIQSSAIEVDQSRVETAKASSPRAIPAPPAGDFVSTTPTVQKSFLERLNEGDESLAILSLEQADAFLALNKTNAESLIAAYRVTHDVEYLRRAATNFPGDPAVLQRVASHDAFPENRRAWLDQFKTADPDNALAHYLSASRYIQENDVASALKDLTAAARAPAFKDYVTDHMQSLEEIYLTAGSTAAEAKALAVHAVELPHVSQAVKISDRLVGLIGEARASGDDLSAQTLAQLGVSLAKHLNGVQDGGNLLGQIVGVKVEERMLRALDQNGRYSFVDGTLTDRLGTLAGREQSIRQDSQFIGEWTSRASESEAVSYFDRLKLYGEASAIEWLKNRSK